MKPDIKYLTQPLLTEEGFVNESCMNELESVIKNMDPTFKRLQNDTEWNTPRWTFRKELVGHFAEWAIRQSTIGVPKGLETVCNYLDSCLKKEYEWKPEGMEELSLCEINQKLHEILMNQGIEEFDNWNQSQSDISFTSRHDTTDPYYNFIDLHALLHNVCISIRDERRKNDAFDKKFEEEYGPLSVNNL